MITGVLTALVNTVKPGYSKVRDPVTGLLRKQHRLVAEWHLGYLLTAEQVVHHRDGNPRNNARANLLVLPSQRHHVALEYHLRRQLRGMLPLFPEILEARLGFRPGVLWGGIVLTDGEEGESEDEN